MVVREFIHTDILMHLAKMDDETLWEFWMHLYNEDIKALPIKNICAWCEEKHGPCDDDMEKCAKVYTPEWMDSEAEVIKR